MPINRILCGAYKNIVTGSVFHLGVNTDSRVQDLEQKQKYNKEYDKRFEKSAFL
jgi:hypothetical protein